MPRAIAFSAKQKREQLQDKRAVKRAELDPSEIRYARNPLGNYRPGANHLPDPTVASTSGSRLHSRFIALTPDYLNRTRDLAHSSPILRPLANDTAIFPLEWMERDEGKLTCPSRPPFQYGQSKEELERNEEQVFAQWMRDTRGFVETWVDYGEEYEELSGEESPEEQNVRERELRSPTWFETKLEVWRQLWRVTESSHILLLLADARCPPLHLPTSLRSYVKALRPRKEVILVLTKSDLVEPDALEGWRIWVKAFWAQANEADESASGTAGKAEDEIQVSTVQSFDADEDAEGVANHKPSLSASSHRQFVDAVRIAHERLRARQPSSNRNANCVDDDSDRHKPPSSTITNVDWASLAKPSETSSDVSNSSQHLPSSVNDPDNQLKPPITIGLIGQPNVGKSSLLNAVLGRTRVKAGRTPGKTKHFQTMFWGDKKEVRFVDCPGLVCPSLVGLEIQALCGILPISQLPSLPACILTAAHFLPLEEIFSIPAPPIVTYTDPYADKRTWRGSRVQTPIERQPSPVAKVEWTAWKILEGRALDKGYLTAKTGRPDVNRAASGMMLALAEGRVRWCFHPPDSKVSGRRGRGIWSGDVGLSAESSGGSGSDEGLEDSAVQEIDNKFFSSVRLDGQS